MGETTAAEMLDLLCGEGRKLMELCQEAAIEAGAMPVILAAGFFKRLSVDQCGLVMADLPQDKDVALRLLRTIARDTSPDAVYLAFDSLAWEITPEAFKGMTQEEFDRAWRQGDEEYKDRHGKRREALIVAIDSIWGKAFIRSTYERTSKGVYTFDPIQTHRNDPSHEIGGFMLSILPERQ